jgi:hypothetical protein
MDACKQESKIPGPDQISTTCQSEGVIITQHMAGRAGSRPHSHSTTLHRPSHAMPGPGPMTRQLATGRSAYITHQHQRMLLLRVQQQLQAHLNSTHPGPSTLSASSHAGTQHIQQLCLLSDPHSLHQINSTTADGIPTNTHTCHTTPTLHRYLHMTAVLVLYMRAACSAGCHTMCFFTPPHTHSNCQHTRLDTGRRARLSGWLLPPGASTVPQQTHTTPLNTHAQTSTKLHWCSLSAVCPGCSAAQGKLRCAAPSCPALPCMPRACCHYHIGGAPARRSTAQRNPGTSRPMFSGAPSL